MLSPFSALPTPCTIRLFSRYTFPFIFPFHLHLSRLKKSPTIQDEMPFEVIAYDRDILLPYVLCVSSSGCSLW